MRRTEAPAWAAYPLGAGALALLTAVAGLFWDVAYHVDHGRDANLFTPAHLLILGGLLGLSVAATGSIVFATRTGLEDAWSLRRLRIPRATAPLALMSGAALAGFPLDDLWHRTYGIDVTLWSPTHLVMIGGGVFATFALCLYLPEAGLDQARSRLLRFRRVSLFGATLLGLSVFLLEFDFGIPQWRAVYHPLLVATAAALTLVAARRALGRWGAVRAAAFYAVLRLLLALFVDLAGHAPPAAPLMLPEALLVELAFCLESRLGAPRVAVLAGALIAGPGLATEWLWTQVAYPLPWHPSLLLWMWLPGLAAIFAAIAGLAFGSAVGRRGSGLPSGTPLIAMAILGGLLAIPLPRHSAAGEATITTSPAGPARQIQDRLGRPATEQDMRVSVTVHPDGYADKPDWFVILAWQGGGRKVIHLRETGAGRYEAVEPVPTGGSWKSMVFLGRSDVLAAAPISFPPDPEYRQAGYPIAPEQVQAFRPASSLMLSEAHPGAPWVAWTAYAALIGVAIAWVLGVAVAAAVISRSHPGPVPVRRVPA